MNKILIATAVMLAVGTVSAESSFKYKGEASAEVKGQSSAYSGGPGESGGSATQSSSATATNATGAFINNHQSNAGSFTVIKTKSSGRTRSDSNIISNGTGAGSSSANSNQSGNSTTIVNTQYTNNIKDTSFGNGTAIIEASGNASIISESKVNSNSNTFVSNNGSATHLTKSSAENKSSVGLYSNATIKNNRNVYVTQESNSSITGENTQISEGIVSGAGAVDGISTGEQSSTIKTDQTGYVHFNRTNATNTLTGTGSSSNSSELSTKSTGSAFGITPGRSSTTTIIAVSIGTGTLVGFINTNDTTHHKPSIISQESQPALSGIGGYTWNNPRRGNNTPTSGISINGINDANAVSSLLPKQ